MRRVLPSFAACSLTLCFAFGAISSAMHAQLVPVSDAQAINLASQSIAALTGAASIVDVTLSGRVTWDGSKTGNATLKALGQGESRIDLFLDNGTRTEVRDSQTGVQQGYWSTSQASGSMSLHNCQTDAAWFFPAFSSLKVNSSIVLSYIGQETRDGIAIQHVRAYRQTNAVLGTTFQMLSATDFYLNASTFLPVAIAFNVHPDDNQSIDIPTEVRFSEYQSFNGAQVPTHIARYQQGHLMADIVISSVSFDTGLPLTTFAVN